MYKVVILFALLHMCAASPSQSRRDGTSTPTTSQRPCPVCEPEYCPKTSQECAHDLVRDECGCCKEGVCLLREKENCFNVDLHKNISLTSMKKLSVCGEYMECALNTNVNAGEIPQSVCQCEKIEVSCGRDNVTYPFMCRLREAKTELRHAGPCKSRPHFVSEPEADSCLEHETLSLNCEVKGFPVPQLHWEFEGLNGLFKLLPGDDSSVAVQSRGGPEPLTVSSWLMVESLRDSIGIRLHRRRQEEGSLAQGLVQLPVFEYKVNEPLFLTYHIHFNAYFLFNNLIFLMPA